MKLTFYSTDLGRNLDVEEIWFKTNRFTVRGPDGFITVLDGVDRLIDNMCDEIRLECEEKVQGVLTKLGVHKDAGIRRAISDAIMGRSEK